MGAKMSKRYFSHILVQFQPNFVINMLVMGEYRLLLFWPPQKYGTLKFLLIQDHMGLDISKHHSSYIFRLMSAKLDEDIGCHGGIQAITFLGNQPGFKNFVAL